MNNRGEHRSLTQKLYMKNSLYSAAIFAGFIGVFCALLFVLPKNDFSERENRYLADAPTFSFATLMSGEFTSKVETYVSDRFAFRGRFVTLKAAAETAVGKRENNGVYFADGGVLGGVLIERFDEPDPEQVRKNAQYVADFAEKLTESGVDVYVSLIPGAGEVWKYRLPKNAPSADQRAIIDNVYTQMPETVKTVDIEDALSSHRNDIFETESGFWKHQTEGIFFKTDHHWTGLGAYYGYLATAEAMRLAEYEPIVTRDTGVEFTNIAFQEIPYKPFAVSKKFLGSAYSSSGAGWTHPEAISAYVPTFSVAAIDYNGTTPTVGYLYNPDALLKKDKYTYFLGGNSPRRVIFTGNDGLPKLLIIRDSFADIEVPYFLPHFSEIHLIDLRYYKRSASKYVEEHGIDSILINYSVKNFAEDTNLFMLNY
jgi:hypothetical protein